MLSPSAEGLCWGAGLSKEQFGLLAPQSSQVICTTEQDAAHCGAKGTGMSSSSCWLGPLRRRLADANGHWGRLPQSQGCAAVNFPGSLSSDKPPSSKTWGYVAPAAAGVCTPAPVLDPALLGSWRTRREDKGKIWSEEM